jgi:hypothetical protein
MSLSISEAIQRARPHDHIRVKSAELTETIVIDRPLTIVADAPGQTVLQPRAGAPCLRIAADAHIHGFILRAGGAPGTKAIEVVAGRSIVESCNFESVNSAIILSGDGTFCTIRNCRMEKCGVGVNLSGQAQVELEGCDIDHASLYPLVAGGRSSVQARACSFTNTHLGGIVIYQGSHGDFEQCEWAASPTEPDQQRRPFHAQLMVQDGGNVVLRRCGIRSGLAVGVQLGKGGQAQLVDCEITGNGWAGVQSSDESSVELLRCRVLNNGAAGVAVFDGARVSAIEIESIGNKAAGLSALRRGTFELRSSRLSGNIVGVYVSEQAGGRIEDSDLTGNQRGPIVADPGSPLECLGTRL